MKPPLTSHTHPSIVSRNYVLPYVATCGDVIKCPQNTCHMAINMLQLPYGNERETNDGRRVTSASQRAWMEPLQAQAPRTGILLCSKVEARRNLHHFTNQVANPHQRGSTEENTGFLRGKGNQITLSVAERMPNCFQHLSIHSCLSYLVVILPYGTAKCKGWLERELFFMRKLFSFKPIETVYNGYRFRSRLEARWAVFFDALGIPYEYEKEGFDLDGTCYLPDFWLPEQDCWVEIKGEYPSDEEHAKTKQLALYTQKPVATFYGNIEMPTRAYATGSYIDEPPRLWLYQGRLLGKGIDRQELDVPSDILAVFQKLTEAHIGFSAEGCFRLDAEVGLQVKFLDDMLEYMQIQYNTILEVKSFLEDRHDEIEMLLLPPDDKWKVGFIAQHTVSASRWECERCGAIVLRNEDSQHQCNGATIINLRYDTPRLIQAYTAARQARFGR